MAGQHDGHPVLEMLVALERGCEVASQGGVALGVGAVGSAVLVELVD